MSSFKRGKFSVDKQTRYQAEEDTAVEIDRKSNPTTTHNQEEIGQIYPDELNEDNERSEGYSPEIETNDVDAEDSDCSMPDDSSISRGNHDNDLSNNQITNNHGNRKFTVNQGLTPADIRAKQLVLNLAREKKMREEKRRLKEEKYQKKLLEAATFDADKLRLERSEHIKEERRKKFVDLPKLREEKRREEEEKRKNATQIVKNYNKNGYKYKVLEADHENINDKAIELVREDQMKKEEAIKQRIIMIREKDHRVDPKKKEIYDKTLNLPNIHCDKSVIRKFRDIELQEKEDKMREKMSLEKIRQEGLKLLKEHKVMFKVDHKKETERKEIYNKQFTQPRQKVDVVDPRPWRQSHFLKLEKQFPSEKILTPQQKELKYIEKRRENTQKANEYLLYQSYQRREIMKRKKEEQSRNILQSHLSENRQNNKIPTQYTKSHSGYDSVDYENNDDQNNDEYENDYNDDEYMNDNNMEIDDRNENDNNNNDQYDNNNNDEYDNDNHNEEYDNDNNNAQYEENHDQDVEENYDTVNTEGHVDNDNVNNINNEIEDENHTISANGNINLSGDNITSGNANGSSSDKE